MKDWEGWLELCLSHMSLEVVDWDGNTVSGYDEYDQVWTCDENWVKKCMEFIVFTAEDQEGHG